MVHPSSCDIEEALDLLFLSPAYGPHSPLLNLHPGFLIAMHSRTGPKLTIWLQVSMLH
jgi:hypothetical protein